MHNAAVRADCSKNVVWLQLKFSHQLLTLVAGITRASADEVLRRCHNGMSAIWCRSSERIGILRLRHAHSGRSWYEARTWCMIAPIASASWLKHQSPVIDLAPVLTLDWHWNRRTWCPRSPARVADIVMSGQYHWNDQRLRNKEWYRTTNAAQLPENDEAVRHGLLNVWLHGQVSVKVDATVMDSCECHDEDWGSG